MFTDSNPAMLSYRHAYHAGNHADILKHLVLAHCLAHLNIKDKPWFMLDTHAGAGSYAMDSGAATKTGEAAQGIARLWQRSDLPPSVGAYVEVVAACNGVGKLTRYPGSPRIAAHFARRTDNLRFCELHPTDFSLLRREFRNSGRSIVAQQVDGFESIKAALPPPSRRGLLLIDPSYETGSDYPRLLVALKDALKRFATGTYLVWMPFLPNLDSIHLPSKLKKLPVEWLLASLSVRGPTTRGHGMTGSAMFVINPPWTLASALQEALPYLTAILGLDEKAHWQLDTSNTDIEPPFHAARGHS